MGYLKLNKDAKAELRPKFRSNGQRGIASLCIPIMCGIGNTAKPPESRQKLPEIKDDEEEEKPSLEEKQRDAMIDWINKKLKGDEREKAFETVGKDLLNKYSDYLPLLNLKLDIYKDGDNTKLVKEIADEIISKIDKNELLAFLGKKVVDKTDPEYKKNNKKYKEQKSSIIDALKAKLNAAKKDLSGKKGGDYSEEKKDEDKTTTKKQGGDAILDLVRVPKDDLKEFSDIYKELGEWTDPEKDKKLFDVNLWYNLQKGLISKALAMINDKIAGNAKEDKAVNKDEIEMKIKLYKKYLPSQLFGFLVEQYQLDLFKKFPNQYRPF